ncbi:MAG TPA: TonB-dependent receptor, partial [Gemmatimonadales bacterium]|nr:TonB-dependent receptor [Gemmatimonadales bacterium]
DEQIIKNIRTNSGLRVSLLNQTQFRNAQAYRMNPYAMQAGGFITTGLDAPLALSSEQRRTGRWELQWKAPDHRQYITVGVDADGADLTNYSAGSPLSEAALDAWTASPSRTGIFFEDVISFRSVTLEAGARYDRVNPGVVLPDVAGFTFSNPNWDASLNSTSPDAQYQASVSKVFFNTRTQGFVTPRVRVTWEADQATSVHAAVGQTLVTPRVGAVAANSNADLTFTSAGSVFGRDVADGVASSIEAGVRRRFGAATSADVTGYYDAHIPVFGEGFQLGVGVLAQTDHAHRWGLDGGVTHQFGPVASATASYSINVNGVSNGIGSSITTHQMAAAVQAKVPDAWAQEGWRSAFKDVAAVVQFRMINGITYTPLQNAGAGTTAPEFNVGVNATQAGAINSERLPWTKLLDLRLTKGVRMNGMDWTIFADFRNLLNFKNLYGLYAETNDTANGVFMQNRIASEFVNLANEANSNGALSGTSVTLPADCGSWQGAAGPVDCVMLKRAEARFGNGDGVYTQAEQTKAFTAYFNSIYGASRFYGPQRTVRVGLSLAL